MNSLNKHLGCTSKEGCPACAQEFDLRQKAGDLVDDVPRLRELTKTAYLNEAPTGYWLGFVSGILERIERDLG